VEDARQEKWIGEEGMEEDENQIKHTVFRWNKVAEGLYELILEIPSSPVELHILSQTSNGSNTFEALIQYGSGEDQQSLIAEKESLQQVLEAVDNYMTFYFPKISAISDRNAKWRNTNASLKEIEYLKKIAPKEFEIPSKKGKLHFYLDKFNREKKWQTLNDEVVCFTSMDTTSQQWTRFPFFRILKKDILHNDLPGLDNENVGTETIHLMFPVQVPLFMDHVEVKENILGLCEAKMFSKSISRVTTEHSLISNVSLNKAFLFAEQEVQKRYPSVHLKNKLSKNHAQEQLLV